MPLSGSEIIARNDDPGRRLERMLDEMRQRGYVRGWRMEQQYDSRQRVFTVDYGDGRRQNWALDQDMLMSTPQYADYIYERIERDLMREIAERGPDMMPSRYRRVSAMYSPDDFNETSDYRPAKKKPPEKPKPKELSASNAYRFDYLEFMEVKKS